MISSRWCDLAYSPILASGTLSDSRSSACAALRLGEKTQRTKLCTGKGKTARDLACVGNVLHGRILHHPLHAIICGMDDRHSQGKGLTLEWIPWLEEELGQRRQTSTACARRLIVAL